jgi:hypothetical protein
MGQFHRRWAPKIARSTLPRANKGKGPYAVRGLSAETRWLSLSSPTRSSVHSSRYEALGVPWLLYWNYRWTSPARSLSEYEISKQRLLDKRELVLSHVQVGALEVAGLGEPFPVLDDHRPLRANNELVGVH